MFFNQGIRIWRVILSFNHRGNSFSSAGVGFFDVWFHGILGFLGDFWGLFVYLILRCFELLDIDFRCCLSCLRCYLLLGTLGILILGSFDI